MTREARLSQVEFAERLGVPRSAPNQWLGGEKNPTRGQVFAIADFFGCTSDSLFGRVPARGQAIVSALQKIDALAAALRGIIPADWSESDLEAWEAYQQKRKKLARPKPAADKERGTVRKKGKKEKKDA